MPSLSPLYHTVTFRLHLCVNADTFIPFTVYLKSFLYSLLDKIDKKLIITTTYKVTFVISVQTPYESPTERGEGVSRINL